MSTTYVCQHRDELAAIGERYKKKKLYYYCYYFDYYYYFCRIVIISGFHTTFRTLRPIKIKPPIFEKNNCVIKNEN